MNTLLNLFKILFFLLILAGTIVSLADGEYLRAFIGGVFLIFYSLFAFTEPESLDAFLDSDYPEGENRG